MEILNPKRNGTQSQVYGMEILNPKEMVTHNKNIHIASKGKHSRIHLSWNIKSKY